MLAEPMERLVSRLMDAAVWFAAGTFCSGAAAVVSQVFFGMTFGSDLGFLALGAEAAALGLPALAFVREDKRSFADLVAGTRVLAAR